MSNKKENNKSEIRLAENTNPIVNSINLYFRKLKYYLNNNKVPTGEYTIPAAILTSLGIAPFLTNAAAATTGTLGGLVGGTMTDYAAEHITGKNWGENISRLTGLDVEPASFTNPGYFMGANRALANRTARLNANKNVFIDTTIKELPSPKLLPKNTEVKSLPIIRSAKLDTKINLKPNTQLIIPIISLTQHQLPYQAEVKLLESPTVNKADLLLKEYLANPEIENLNFKIPREDLEILKNATPLKYRRLENIFTYDIRKLKRYPDYYNPFESNFLLEGKGFPEKFAVILDDNYLGHLNLEFINNFNNSLGYLSEGGLKNGDRLNNLKRQSTLPIEYKHLSIHKIKNNPDLQNVRRTYGIPEKPGIKGIYTLSDIESFTPEQVLNFIDNSNFNEGFIVPYNSGDFPERILNILFGNKNEGFNKVYKLLRSNLKKLSSGSTYITSSLSTDSYPIVQTILGNLVKNGTMVPKLSGDIRYKSLNSLGFKNSWDYNDFENWFKSLNNLDKNLFNFNKISDKEYDVIYNGNNVSRIRRRTKNEIINYLNNLNQKLFGENYPKVKGDRYSIDIPIVPFITRKNGGKL